jgi:quinol monooxygenase YgiN
VTAYGSYVKFTAQAGQRDTLVQHMLEAARGVQSLSACSIYLINISQTEPDSIWVTEVWQSQQEHDASLQMPEVQAAIKRVLPLLAHSPEKIDVMPVGGKGVTLI